MLGTSSSSRVDGAAPPTRLQKLGVENYSTKKCGYQSRRRTVQYAAAKAFAGNGSGAPRGRARGGGGSGGGSTKAIKRRHDGLTGSLRGPRSSGRGERRGGRGGGAAAAASSAGMGAVVGEEGAEVFEVESLLGRRIGVGGEPQYLVHWRGYPSSEDTWEPWTSLVACTDGVSAFHETMFADGTAPVGYAVGAPSPSHADADPSLPRWRILVKRTASGREYRIYYGPLGEHVRSRATALQLRALYEIPAHVVVPEVPWDTAVHSRASGRAVAASAAAIAAGNAAAIAAGSAAAIAAGNAAAVAAGNAAAIALLRQHEGVAVSGASTGKSMPKLAGLPLGPGTPDSGLVGGLSGGSLAGCLNIGPMEGSTSSAVPSSLFLSPTTNILGQPLPQLTTAQLAQAAWGCQTASAATASAVAASAAAAAAAPPSAAASMLPSASAASMASLGSHSLGSQDGGPAGSCDSWTSDAEAAALADALFS